VRREILYLKEIYLSLGQKKILKDISLHLYEGELTALLGLNGVGKTMLLKLIAGIVRKNSGELFLDGQPLEIRNPREGTAKGIMYLPDNGGYNESLTELENTFLDSDHTFLLHSGRDRKMFRLLQKEYGIDFSALWKEKEGNIGRRKLLRLFGLLRKKPRILLIDEPLAYLNSCQKEIFFDCLRLFLAGNTSILISTHDLDFAVSWASRSYILGFEGIKRYIDDADELKNYYGKIMNPQREGKTDRENVKTDPVLYVCSLRTRLSDNVSFVVNRGEVTGLTGGNTFQRRELLTVIAGLQPYLSGSIELEKAGRRESLSAGQLKKMITYIAQDQNSLIETMCVRDNIILGNIRRASYGGCINKRLTDYFAGYYLGLVLGRMAEEDGSNLEELLDQPVDELSYGLRRAVQIAQGLSREKEILLIDSPTLGMDIQVMENLNRLFAHLKKEGKGCLLITNENEDLYLCDRIIHLN